MQVHCVATTCLEQPPSWGPRMASSTLCGNYLFRTVTKLGSQGGILHVYLWEYFSVHKCVYTLVFLFASDHLLGSVLAYLTGICHFCEFAIV